MSSSSEEQDETSLLKKLQTIRHHAVDINQELSNSIKDLDRTESQMQFGVGNINTALNAMKDVTANYFSTTFWMVIGSVMMFFVIYLFIF